MARAFTKLCVLLIKVFAFSWAMMLVYDAQRIYPVHEAIDLAVGDLPSRPTSWELVQYLRATVLELQVFAPNSAQYVPDSELLKLLPNPVQAFGAPLTSSQWAIDRVLPPVFTMLVWVRTTERLGALLTRTRHDKICWSIGIEQFLHGGHEGDLQSFTNPLARDVWRPGLTLAQQDAAWQASALRRLSADGAWHHVGLKVDVRRQRVEFVLDGNVSAPTVLRRVLTDCEGGSVVLGARQPAWFFDLQLHPALLSRTEILDIFQNGVLAAELAASAARQPSESEQNEAQYEDLLQRVSEIQQKMDDPKSDVGLLLKTSMSGMLEALAPQIRQDRRLAAPLPEHASADRAQRLELVGKFPGNLPPFRSPRRTEAATVCADEDVAACRQAQYEYLEQEIGDLAVRSEAHLQATGSNWQCVH